LGDPVSFEQLKPIQASADRVIVLGTPRGADELKLIASAMPNLA
jgi:hypothetical protein